MTAGLRRDESASEGHLELPLPGRVAKEASQGGTPNHPAMDDHDLILKPMVTWGSFIYLNFLRNLICCPPLPPQNSAGILAEAFKISNARVERGWGEGVDLEVSS